MCAQPRLMAMTSSAIGGAAARAGDAAASSSAAAMHDNMPRFTIFSFFVSAKLGARASDLPGEPAVDQGRREGVELRIDALHPPDRDGLAPGKDRRHDPLRDPFGLVGFHARQLVVVV